MTPNGTGDQQAHPSSMHIAVGAAGLMMCVVCSTSAQAQAPSCSPAPKALRLACSDATLEASISALRIAYQIASDDVHAGMARKAALRREQVAWMRRVAACGNDSRCIAAAIVDRQRQINETRLGGGDRSPVPQPPATPHRTLGEAADEREVSTTASSAAGLPETDSSAEPGRDDWPVPPAYAPATIVAPYEAPATQNPGPPTEGVRTDGGEPAGRSMSPMLLCAALVALGFPLALYVVLRGSDTATGGGGRCPKCRKATLRSEAVPVEGAKFARRRGPGRGVAEMTTQRIRRTCPCGYSSDVKPVATQTTDAQAELHDTKKESI